MTTQVSVQDLYVYPIKSCAGIRLERAELTPRGFRHDRRWMLIDPQARFLSQRKLPRMALIEVSIASDHLDVRAPGMPPLEVPWTLENSSHADVSIWKDTVHAAHVSRDHDAWFSEFLGGPCHLMFMEDAAERVVASEYERPGASPHVSFADGFPYLVLSAESVAEIDRRAPVDVGMERFRPNIVVSGQPAFAEDGWAHLERGDMRFELVKPCARCALINVKDGAREGAEPLKSLVSWRSGEDGQVYVGQNALGPSQGVLSVGDVLTATLSERT